MSPEILLLWKKKRTDNRGKLGVSAPRGEKKILLLNADKTFNKMKHVCYQSAFSRETEVYTSTQIYILTEYIHTHTHTHTHIYCKQLA